MKIRDPAVAEEYEQRLKEAEEMVKPLQITEKELLDAVKVYPGSQAGPEPEDDP